MHLIVQLKREAACHLSSGNCLAAYFRAFLFCLVLQIVYVGRSRFEIYYQEKKSPMLEKRLSRRAFASAATAGLIVVTHAGVGISQEKDKSDGKKKTDDPKTKSDENVAVPVEEDFERDYDEPKFKPRWKKKQINRQMAADFVIYAHSDIKMVRMLLEREPGLLNATLDWGAGDWETALGGASHMGREDIAKYLLGKGARMDLFCSAMMGQLEVVKSMLTLEPTLIDAKGPHGFSLHWHAQVGADDAKPVLEYLQSVKEVELRPVPWLKKKSKKKSDEKKVG